MISGTASVERRARAFELFEKEHVSPAPTSPWAFRCWAVLGEYAVEHLTKSGHAGEARALCQRFELLVERHRAVIASGTHVDSAVTAARGSLARWLRAAPLPAPSAASILGASDDPTPRRDRPGLKEVR